MDNPDWDGLGWTVSWDFDVVREYSVDVEWLRRFRVARRLGPGAWQGVSGGNEVT